MLHGLNFGVDVSPWGAYQVRPWRSRGFFRTALANLIVNEVTPVITFTTDEYAVRLARLLIHEDWLGSAEMLFFVRSRGAVLEEYMSQWTHDSEQGLLVQRLDVICPPSSQIELSGLSLTDTGNDRPVQWTVTGWLESWPESRVLPDRWAGE